MRDDRALFQELCHETESHSDFSVSLVAELGPETLDKYSGGDVRPLYQALIDVAQVAGVPVNRTTKLPEGAPARVGGWFLADRISKRVVEIGVVTGDRPLHVQARSLLHELGHLFTAGVTEYSAGDAEIIGESAAYIVGTRLGFDTLAHSSGYVAGWTRPSTPTRDLNPLRVRQLERPILEAAARLGRAIDCQYSLPVAA